MAVAISSSVLIALFDNLPIDNLPERSQVVRSAILIVQVIRMLPHVEGQQWLQPLLHRIRSIRLLSNHELTILISRQPYPTRAEQRSPTLLERLLECLERPKVTHDSLSQFSCRGIVSLRRSKLPKVHPFRLFTYPARCFP